MPRPYGNRAADYLPQLDGVRCLAVLAVLLAHFHGHELLGRISMGRLPLGAMGVHCFFVLSGFLITGILLDVRRRAGRAGQGAIASCGRFYLRRIVRIFPAYYATLAVLLVLNVAAVSDYLHWHFAYATNVIRAIADDHMSPVGHFWSLAVEEQFYLVWPWLVLLLPIRWVPRAAIGMVIVGVSWRMTASALGLGHFWVDQFTLGCLDLLGVGALLGWVWFRHGPAAMNTSPFGDAGAHAIPDRTVVWMRHILRVGLWVGLPVLLLQQLFWHAGQSLPPPVARTASVVGAGLQPLVTALLYAWLIDGAARGFDGVGGRLLEARPVVYVGKISYGIYLYHMPFRWFVHAHVYPRLGLTREAVNPAIELLLLSAGSVAVAAAAWHLFEAPFNRLKVFFPYIRKAKQPVPATGPSTSPVGT